MVAVVSAPPPDAPAGRSSALRAAGPDGRRLRRCDPWAAAELGRACGVGPTVGQLLLHRGVTDAEAARSFLHPRLAALTPPGAMAGRSEAALRLARAVRARERVVVFGDYDVDGTTSASLLAEVLQALGGDVRAYCANRFDGGYGLSDAALDRVLEARPGVLVTCDCGSSDHARIARAKAAGVDVVVVDHHLVPDEPLPADAFLNPHQPGCSFPYKGLCSAGLALSVGAAVRAELGIALDLRRWLDLVALGTIADVAPLDGDNRCLVRAGLQLLASPQARPGVLALRELTRLRGGAVTGVDVAFRLAPRLNAAGRLGDAKLTVDLLRAATLPEARAHAMALETVNRERRSLQERITEEALAQAEAVYGDRVDGGVVVAAEGWHRGVVGIVAARLAERLGAPSLVVALDDGVGHGSGRTPAGFDLHRALAGCRAHLERFGGHAAAAGVTVRAEAVDALRAAFDDACRTARAAAPPLEPKAPIDLVLGGGFPLPTAEALSLLEPLGEGNPEPVVLLPEAEVEDRGVVGEGHLRLQLRFGDQRLRAFGWDLGHRADSVGARVSLLGALRPDAWLGGGHLELRIDAIC